MHFIGMLAVELPIAMSYDPLSTLASALVAVLVVGVAFPSLHFGIRTKVRVYTAGTLTGLGIVGMHYLGMSAISANCVVTYNPVGVLLAIGIGVASSIAAIELAYGNRSLLSISAGAVVAAVADDHADMPGAARYLSDFSLADLPLSSTDAAIIATRGKRGRDALRAVLESGAGYKGMVCSRKKRRAPTRQLATEDPKYQNSMADLHAPAGLHIGAIEPEEIALSVMSEIVARHRLGNRRTDMSGVEAPRTA